MGDGNRLFVAVGDVCTPQGKARRIEMIEAAVEAFLVTDAQGECTQQQITAIIISVIKRAAERKAVLCAGQVKTDTKLSNQSKFFILIGTNIPEIRVLPSAVVEHLNVIDNIVLRFLPGGVIALQCPLLL